MYVKLCRHIKTNGLQCRGVALTGTPFCYFHDRLHRRHASYIYTPAAQGYLMPGKDVQLCALEDRESVQLALSVVINALATGNIEINRATALLYGLQLASSNGARLKVEHDPQKAVRSTLSTPDNSNSPGLDLAEPGRVYYIEEEQPDPDETDEPNQPESDGSAGQPLAASQPLPSPEPPTERFDTP